MKKRTLVFLSVAASLFIFATVSLHAEEKREVRPIEPEAPPLDYRLINRIWFTLKAKMNAPEGIRPPPLVLDWKVPQDARMGYQYPTPESPDYRLQISIAPRTIDIMKESLVLFGIGHEFLHHLFLMRENGYDVEKKVFEKVSEHHCDAEFQKLQEYLAAEIWNIFHNDADRNIMRSEIAHSCVRFPEQ